MSIFFIILIQNIRYTLIPVPEHATIHVKSYYNIDFLDIMRGSNIKPNR